MIIMYSTISLLSGFLVFVIILLLAYVCSRYLGKTWQFHGTAKYMEVIDQLAVGQDRLLLIVKINDKNYLMSSSSQGVSILTELDGDFSSEESTGPHSTGDFSQYLNRYWKQFRDGKDSSK